jgi:hypothetical protein
MPDFNPKDHLTKISGRDYLPVAPRIAWFRDIVPSGRIDTDFKQVGEYIIAIAKVYNDNGNLIASGSAMVRPYSPDKGKTSRDIEKAETAAIGRALAVAGFGTMEAGDELNEDGYLADAPVESSGGKTVKKVATPLTDAHTNDEPQTESNAIFRIKSDAGVAAINAPTPEVVNTIRAVWTENTFSKASDIPKATQLVIDRLNKHREVQS